MFAALGPTALGNPAVRNLLSKLCRLSSNQPELSDQATQDRINYSRIERRASACYGSRFST
jgi:hypothetical protein